MKKHLCAVLSSSFLIGAMLCFSGCSSDGAKYYYGAGTGSTGVMLQGFNWNSCKNTTGWYVVMQNNADEIKNTFEFVWCPPPSDSGSDDGYMPRRLNILDSSYGTESQLVSMIASISPAKAVADIVINHRVGTTSWGDFTEPAFDEDFYSICSGDEGFKTSGSGMYGSSKHGAVDTGDDYGSARDLDHTNTKVQKGIITWMTDKLKADGFTGWRYDYVKGYGGKYVGMYNKATSAEFSVGELWPSSNYAYSKPQYWGNEIKNWISSTAEDGGQKSKAFDFALKGAMNTAFGSSSSNIRNTKFSLLADESNLYISQAEDAVTFVDNHDTGSTQQLWYLDPADVGTAYALILTHPGYPCVAWQHYFTAAQSSDSGSQYVADSIVSGTSLTLRQHIDQLMSYRKKYGIACDSAHETLQATYAAYVSKIYGSKGTLVVQIGSGYSPEAGFDELYSGTDFTIWGKLN